MTNYTGSKSIRKLAIKIFLITLHSADCERTFSALAKKISLNNLQVQVASVTFLVEDNERIIEDFEVEEAEYNLEIIEHFDIENIVFLNDEVFRDSESDSDNEEFQDYEDEFEKLNYDKLTGNKTEQDLNTINNIDSNTIDNIDSNTIEKNNANDNITRDSSIIENENEALKSDL
ncbi:7645_t:CDS:2 [Scutellospora calospora]|uniref:7645_t:CDS:1 n=1 Tax=Scutellospora calospora TaxID=85575 RepID=A0ACA9LJF2_9GLOM|nr:7645_t:CDS:2 [Scutellospora calospora]